MQSEINHSTPQLRKRRITNTGALPFMALVLTMLITGFNARGQAALLALIFGDKVATENFHLSVDVGLNLAFTPGLPDNRPTPGLHFGLGTFIKINENWALTPEFKPLSMRRSDRVRPIADVSSVLSEADYSLNLNYIDIPVLIRYNVNPKIYVSMGPQISILTNAEQIGVGKLPSGETGTLSKSVQSSFNKVHWFFPIDVGYTLSAARGGKGLDFRMRYSLGLTDMISSNYGSTRGGVLLLMLSFPFIEDPNKVVAAE